MPSKVRDCPDYQSGLRRPTLSVSGSVDVPDFRILDSHAWEPLHLNGSILVNMAHIA